jgi:hypothetical protein
MGILGCIYTTIPGIYILELRVDISEPYLQ